MPVPVMEATYCSPQIVIPTTFPHILKVFAKAAIRTQPYDLLKWAHAYFKALSEGGVPPVKERLEYPLVRTEGGLSYGYLKLLVKQFETPEEIEKKVLKKRWLGICLCETELKQILCTGGLYRKESFPLQKFIAVAAGYLCQNLSQTMVLLCEIYTDEPDGASASISAELFIDLYKYLASIDASEEVTYYDGLIKEEYEAKLMKPSSIEIVECSSPIIQRWVPLMRGWKTDSTLLKRNIILDADLPQEGGKVSQNITRQFQAPRENYFDPNHPHFPMIPPEQLECHFDDSSASIVPSKKEEQMNLSQIDENLEEEDVESVTPSNSRSGDGEEEQGEGEGGEEEGEAVEEGEGEEPKEEEEVIVDDQEIIEEVPPEAVGSKISEGSNVLVRVFSEDGMKIRSLSTGEELDGNEDISVKDREAIIEQLEMNKEKRVSEFIETIESLDDIVENTKKLKSKADKLINKEEMECGSPISSSTVTITTEEKFTSETTGSSQIAPEHEPEVIVVPPKAGIGPIVETAMMNTAIGYIEETAAYQAGVIMPRDIVHCLCPPLERKKPLASA